MACESNPDESVPQSSQNVTTTDNDTQIKINTIIEDNQEIKKEIDLEPRSSDDQELEITNDTTLKVDFLTIGVKRLSEKLQAICKSTSISKNKPLSGKILVVNADTGELDNDIQSLLPESSQPMSEDDVVFVVGLRRSETEVNTYDDNQPACRVDYRVRLYLYKEKKLVSEIWLKGTDPPFIKYGYGPGYGDAPLGSVVGWIMNQTNTRIQGMVGSHENPVTSLAFSPDGLSLASASKDGVIRLWEVTTGRLKAEFRGSEGEINPIAYSPDGKVLAIAAEDLDVRFWDMTTYSLNSSLKICYYGYGVNNISYSPDGKTMATAGWMCGGVSIWDVETNTKISTLSDDTSPSFAVFSSNGDKLVWTEYEENGNDQKVIIWDLVSNLKLTEYHLGDEYCADFNNDDTMLVIGDWGGQVRVFDLNTNTEIVDLNHNDWIYGSSFNNQGSKLASGSADGNLCIWDTDNWAKIHDIDIDRGINTLAWSPNGEIIAFAGENCLIWLFDTNSQRFVKWE